MNVKLFSKWELIQQIDINKNYWIFKKLKSIYNTMIEIKSEDNLEARRSSLKRTLQDELVLVFQ